MSSILTSPSRQQCSSSQQQQREHLDKYTTTTTRNCFTSKFLQQLNQKWNILNNSIQWNQQNFHPKTISRRNSTSGDPKEYDMLVLKAVDWEENESY